MKLSVVCVDRFFIFIGKIKETNLYIIKTHEGESESNHEQVKSRERSQSWKRMKQVRMM